jgi:hypothetical protein
MATTPSLARDLKSPDLYPQALSALPLIVRLVPMSRSRYDSASFLDDRLLLPEQQGQWLPWQAVATAIDATGRDDARFIWHIGHVGSTLLSRMLAGLPRTLALREPAPLRLLAQIAIDLETPHAYWTGADFDTIAGTLARLWARTYAAGDIAIVKATSVACGIASRLLALLPPRPSIAIYTGAETYLATILGGENSRVEARQLAQLRLRQLNAAMGSELPLAGLSEGELVAMSWLSGMANLQNAARTSPRLWHWLDFDVLLAEPEAMLSLAAHHLGLDAPADAVRAVATGPVMTRYSKAPEQYAYGTALRHEVLAAARADHRAEIAQGLAWLERVATRYDIAHILQIPRGKAAHVS